MTFVAPLVGAWIEILSGCCFYEVSEEVAPLVGAWIEIPQTTVILASGIVAPLVGAWIEIVKIIFALLPGYGRSPRGSVD